VNHATVVSIACFVASFLVAVVGVRMGRAAGWKDQASFALVGFTAALYAAFNLPSTGGVSISDPLVVLATRLQLATGALHAWAWVRFAAENLEERRRRRDVWLERVLLLTAACFALPGVAFTERVTTHEVAELGVWYRLVDETPFGSFLVVFIVAVFGMLALRYLRAWISGRAGTGALALAFGVFFLLTASDAAAVAGLLRAPLLVEVGLFLPVGAVAWVNGTRFIADAQELSELRVRLEHLVEQRTRELLGAHERLRRTERLATLGQVAAGVAHEVNNPAAVVAGNLDYLLAALRRGALPADAEDCIADSSLAVRRISGIVRQLLHAGRVAGQPQQRVLIPIAAIVGEATRAARAAAAHVRVETDVPEWLHALGEEQLLQQVLVNLVVNAVQAVPSWRLDGSVRITARRDADRVRIEVSDNGAGMSCEVLQKAFEPFFTTKGPGKGTGLGLAISRGLVTSLGGELRLESTIGEGTRAVVEIPGEAAFAADGPFGAVAAGRPETLS
jgi:signal transduction histidine kinase